MPRRGDVRPLASGRFTRVVMLGRDDAGRRRRVRVTADTPEQVEAEVARLRSLYQRGRLRESDLDRRTLSEHLATWLADKRGTVGAKAWLHHRANVRRLVTVLGSLRLRELRPEHVRAAYRALAGPPYALAPLTIRHTHATLRLALKQAHADGLVPEVVTMHVRPPRVPPSPAWALTPAEVARLLEASEGEWRRLWLVAVYTGCRIGELLALALADVSFLPSGGASLRIHRATDIDEARHWRLKETPKSAAGVRQIAVPPVVAQALREQAAYVAALRDRQVQAGEWWDEGLLFPSRRGNPHVHSAAHQALARAAERAGLVWQRAWPQHPGRRLHPHILRHTYASALLAAGRPLPEIAALMGHSSAVITLRIYGHWLGTDTQTAAAALAAHYGAVDGDEVAARRRQGE